MWPLCLKHSLLQVRRYQHMNCVTCTRTCAVSLCMVHTVGRKGFARMPSLGILGCVSRSLIAQVQVHCGVNVSTSALGTTSAFRKSFQGTVDIKLACCNRLYSHARIYQLNCQGAQSCDAQHLIALCASKTRIAARCRSKKPESVECCEEVQVTIPRCGHLLAIRCHESKEAKVCACNS